MALNATVFKVMLQIADIDKHYYADHHLTLARHPSETDERMMVRVLAFVLFAGENLLFGKGLSSDDEPALWEKDLTGAVVRWIEVGLPDEKIVRKAAGRAEHVVVVSYGKTADIWWKQNHDKLQRLRNLTVLNFSSESTQQLESLTERTMQLQCNIQENVVLFTSSQGMVEVEVKTWLSEH